ncbi:MAG: S41 family peptidase [Vulcanimicrobiaceae bacterium]
MIPRAALLLLAAALLLPSRPAVATPAALSALDVIALEIGYTTVLARYYEPVDPLVLAGGARTGIVAYLHGRGIAAPAIPLVPARGDKFAAENAIDRDVALAVLRYGSRIVTADLVRNTIAGELAALHDQYSVVFPPHAYQQFVGFLDGRAVGGIGAELDVDPQTRAVRIVDVFPDGPAAAAGLAPGDVLASIDGAPPPVGTPDAVAAALRGPVGTTVRLGIVRDGTAQPPVALVRRAIVPPDVTERRLAGGIGYLRLRTFGAQAPQQLDRALSALRGVRGYVLDLRGDGGGYRDAAIAIAAHFVQGVVVTTQERGAPPQVFRAADLPPLGAPLVVLVDGDTASAAEIVAAAIQDAHAGTLIGTRTFGKGLVQETFPLPDGGAIKLTTARYRTPAGRDIEGVGVVPDVVVSEPSAARPGEPGHDPQLDRALALLGAP